MSYFPNPIQPSSIHIDAGGRTRISQFTTLTDLKTIDADEPHMLENVGTGTGTWSNNKFSMSVTSGQYYVRRSRHYSPYFSGKSQVVECTFDGFNTESNVIKRIGYFSSNAVAPYDSNKDGFWLENDGTTIRLICSHEGTEKLNIPWTSWSGYSSVSNYDWSKFTVVYFDFVWLGGAVIRLFLKSGDSFILCHSFHYAGTATDTFIKSPNHNVRYEIRSSTGSGSFRAICAHVSTEGSVGENGKQRSVDTGYTGITCATIGTTYPIKAIRKSSTLRHKELKATEIGAFVSSNTDIVVLSFQLNPTLSAPLTYSAVSGSCAEEATGNGTITVASPGLKVHSIIITQNSILPSDLLDLDFLSKIGMSIANTSDELVLCITPVTANAVTFGQITYKEF